MASCKDCIHNEICQQIDGPFNIIDADMSCADFKHRARFVELPCKVGDVIFYTTIGKIYQGIVGRIELDDEGFAIITTDGYCVDSTICYHTQKAAEQALKEREENA